jgi:predicted ATP-grasp superfamily ATP-dependent carboligase
MEKVGALIIGGDYQGLGIARSLKQEGIPVCIVDNEFSISRFSRCREVYFKSPSPKEEASFVEFLVKVSRNGFAGWVVFPTNDECVSLLSRHKSQLENFYKIPTPHWDITKFFYDKRLTYKVAERIGIDIPKTWLIQNIEELEKSDISFPAIIKPAIRDRFYPHMKSKAILARSMEELRKAYERVSKIIDPSEIIVQEVIPGTPENLYSLAVFVKERKIVARLVARRMRQHPMDFGHASTFVETVDIPELEQIGEKLLAEVGYYGLAEVEFKFDHRDGKFKLLEVNPRTWGWHTIGLRAGVNFSLILYKDMVGEEFKVNSFRKGVKWVRIITDVPTATKELMKGNLSLSEYINSLRGEKEFAVFSWKDPLPFIMEFFLIPYLWRKRGF